MSFIFFFFTPSLLLFATEILYYYYHHFSRTTTLQITITLGQASEQCLARGELPSAPLDLIHLTPLNEAECIFLPPSLPPSLSTSLLTSISSLWDI